MRATWLLAALVTAGCSDRTGVLLEVSREEAVPADISRLQFFVGVEVEQSFVDDGDAAANVALDPGRDIAADPYVVLRPGGDTEPEMQMMAAVVAFKGEEIVGIGGVGPIEFLDGKVLRYPVLLRGLGGGSVTITETGCLVWSEAEQRVVISAKGDVDCDGDPNDSDCDPANPTVGHGLPEVCENGADDDCDGDQDEVEDVDTDG